MIEKIKVTEEHLDKAIIERPSLPLCECCVMAQAAKDHFKAGEVRCSRRSINIYTGLRYICNDMYDIAQLFEDKKYEELRKMLPLTVEAQPEGG